MYSNDYSDYPQLVGLIIGTGAIGGGLIAFIPKNMPRMLCAIAFGLIPAFVVIFILAMEQVKDLYIIGISLVVTLLFEFVWVLPALSLYKFVRRYRRKRYERGYSQITGEPNG